MASIDSGVVYVVRLRGKNGLGKIVHVSRTCPRLKGHVVMELSVYAAKGRYGEALQMCQTCARRMRRIR